MNTPRDIIKWTCAVLLLCGLIIAARAMLGIEDSQHAVGPDWNMER